MESRPKFAFLLSLLGAILIIMNGVIMIAILSLVKEINPPTETEGFLSNFISGFLEGFPEIKNEVLFKSLMNTGVRLIVLGILVLIGAVMIYSTKKTRVTFGSLFVIFFSINVISLGGGLSVIGAILGIVGSILGLIWKPPEAKVQSSFPS